MNIVVVSGSSRPQNQSLKIASWAQQKLQASGADVFLVDLHQHILPTETNLDVLNLNDAPDALKAWMPIRKQLQQADGFLFVVPEWNGMAPPALMNFMLHAAADETKPLAHKPIMLWGVSSTKYGGAYPLAQVHSFGMKNAMGFYTPNHVVIRNVNDVFNDVEPAPNSKEDAYLQKRAQHSLQVLLQYARSLAPMRAQSDIDLLAYPNGL
jgi:NAD(P)H-dependent FMN reductase